MRPKEELPVGLQDGSPRLDFTPPECYLRHKASGQNASVTVEVGISYGVQVEKHNYIPFEPSLGQHFTLWILKSSAAPTWRKCLQRPKMKDTETRLDEHHDWAGSSPVLLATKGRRMSQSQI